MSKLATRTTIIAEVGVNHNGSFALAKEIVDKFSKIDVDYIKFQTFSSDLLVVPNAPKAEYQRSWEGDSTTAFEMLNDLALSTDEFVFLKNYVESKGKKFLSTGFDHGALDFLASIGATVFKVPSGEITNLPYLRHVAELAQEVILSTGMSTLNEVANAVNSLYENGITSSQLIIMQCNSAYPSPIGDANVRAMTSMGEKFGTRVGYSDHTLGSNSALAAVALGASVIEKHVTLDRLLPGPDHAASMELEEFEGYVQAIREVETALGSFSKVVTPSESENRLSSRRGIYAARLLRAGEELTLESVAVLRPATQVSPMEIDNLVGKVLTRDFQKFEALDSKFLI